MLQDVAVSPDIEPVQAFILNGMLAPRPDDRPSADDVVKFINQMLQTPRRPKRLKR